MLLTFNSLRKRWNHSKNPTCLVLSSGMLKLQMYDTQSESSNWCLYDVRWGTCTYENRRNYWIFGVEFSGSDNFITRNLITTRVMVHLRSYWCNSIWGTATWRPTKRHAIMACFCNPTLDIDYELFEFQTSFTSLSFQAIDLCAAEPFANSRDMWFHDGIRSWPYWTSIGGMHLCCRKNRYC